METPIVTAALHRKPRRCPRAIQQTVGGGGAKNHPHNYIAEASKKRAGAALGNRHAARGRAARVDRHKSLDALVQQTSSMAQAVDMAVAIGRLERQRLAALLEAAHAD